MRLLCNLNRGEATLLISVRNDYGHTPLELAQYLPGRENLTVTLRHVVDRMRSKGETDDRMVRVLLVDYRYFDLVLPPLPLQAIRLGHALRSRVHRQRVDRKRLAADHEAVLASSSSSNAPSPDAPEPAARQQPWRY